MNAMQRIDRGLLGTPAKIATLEEMIEADTEPQ